MMVVDVNDVLLLLLQQNDGLLLLRHFRKSWRRISAINFHPKHRSYFEIISTIAKKIRIIFDSII